MIILLSIIYNKSEKVPREKGSNSAEKKSPRSPEKKSPKSPDGNGIDG